MSKSFVLHSAFRPPETNWKPSAAWKRGWRMGLASDYWVTGSGKTFYHRQRDCRPTAAADDGAGAKQNSWRLSSTAR
ncbi:hypothetical protein LNP74_33390 [Klebsiella pneumoniae subsp. pneumoniae]|nr:hypothetical protein [Klebsiella pneumoniae subsp. pneumoniae]